MNINPIYTQFNRNNLAEFNSSKEDLELGPSEADLSIDNRTFLGTCKKIALFILKIVIFPWGLYEGIRWLIQRAIMAPLYPAQNSIIKMFFRNFQTEELDEKRVDLAANLREKGYLVRHIALEKDGTRYSGLCIGKEDTLSNGKWVLQACGNGVCIENAADRFADNIEDDCPYLNADYNLLMINGPGVGRSEGSSNAKTIGEAQELGITYLEEAMKATEIGLVGHSLGGAALASAVLQHEFKLDTCQYHVIPQLSFDRTSNVSEKFVEKVRNDLEGMEGTVVAIIRFLCTHLQPYAKSLIEWTECEIDTIAASRKLILLGIKETVFQAGNPQAFEDDGVVSNDSTKGHTLVEEGVAANTLTIKRLPNQNHNDVPHSLTLEALEAGWAQPQIQLVIA